MREEKEEEKREGRGGGGREGLRRGRDKKKEDHRGTGKDISS